MEERNEPEFSLTPILNPETKEYSLRKFDEVKIACSEFIKRNSIENVSDEEDFKNLKKYRTNIRKKKETIKSARLSLIKLFSFQFKELESMLEVADAQLKQQKDEFEAKQTESVEPIKEASVNTDIKEVTLIIKYRDINIIDNLIKTAVSNGCEVITLQEKK